MNEWIAASIKLANSPGYLDKLLEVYEMQVNPHRAIPDDTVKALKAVYDKGDNKQLIKMLIEYAPVFPVKDSYIGFIRIKPEAIDENPVTVKRIAERLHALGFNKMIEEASRPKETNRQLGSAFKKWLTKAGYKLVNREEMLASKSGICLLQGSDKTLSTFAYKELGCRLRKGIDLVLKKDTKYLIGEAKFLTTPGGEQNGGFADAESFISEGSGDATRIALLDGYVWLASISGLHDKIKRSDADIMSALLLKRYVESL
jgi:hypothetical protein